jgi:hypothetical protein
MTTTILNNPSWLGEDGLNLFELIVASFILLRWYLFLTWCDYSKGELPYSQLVWEKVCLSSLMMEAQM